MGCKADLMNKEKYLVTSEIAKNVRNCKNETAKKLIENSV